MKSSLSTYRSGPALLVRATGMGLSQIDLSLLTQKLCTCFSFPCELLFGFFFSSFFDLFSFFCLDNTHCLLLPFISFRTVVIDSDIVLPHWGPTFAAGGWLTSIPRVARRQNSPWQTSDSVIPGNRYYAQFDEGKLQNRCLLVLFLLFNRYVPSRQALRLQPPPTPSRTALGLCSSLPLSFV